MSFFQQFRSIISKVAPAPDTVPQQGTVNPSAQPTEPIERRSRKRLNSHKGRRVLIIDDSPTIVAVLKKTLRSAGCLTMEALDAEHGLEIVRQEKPDLVFLDIVLPGMNGFAALRLMRRDPATQHIPVIMISGNEQATEQFYAKRIGADDFMKKPFSRFEVFGRMESLVELKKLAAIRQNTSTDRPIAQAPTAQAGIPATPSPAPAFTPPFASSTPPQTATTQRAIQVQAAPTHALHPTQTAAVTATMQRPASPPVASTPTITALEARSQLTAMGLQYFNQEQFQAALQRKDKLAIDLFIAGGGVSING